MAEWMHKVVELTTLLDKLSKEEQKEILTDAVTKAYIGEVGELERNHKRNMKQIDRQGIRLNIGLGLLLAVWILSVIISAFRFKTECGL